MRIFACDPGLASGWASWDSGTPPVSGIADPTELYRHLDCWADNPPGLLVFEAYTITAQTLKKSRQNEPLELIGVGRYLAHKYGHKFELQKPAEAKSLVPDARLRQMGMYVSGRPDHERDARRHLVLALARYRLVVLEPLA